MLNHLACIMDGNRRWAARNSLKPWIGHQEGAKSVKSIVKFCLDHEIPHLSLYAFSLENFKRSQEEKSFIFSIMVEQAEKLLPELMEKNIRILFLGNRALFPESVQPTINKIEQATQSHTRLTAYILFCYGGQQEFLEGVKSAAQALAEGKIAADALTLETFSQFLWTQNMPSPDLIIRTGGVQRLSNFLLFHAAYSELYFTDCLWPDINSQELEKALSFFQSAKRNFGQ